MLMRLSGRLACLLLFISLCVLWTSWDGIPGFQALDWTLYTVDVSDGHLSHNKSHSVTIQTTPTSNTNESITPISMTTTSRKPLMTGFPVISKPSPYGYIFYATADDYACAVLLNIKRLRHLFHTRHQIHVLVAPNVGRSYIEAFESFQAIVTVREPPSLGPGSIPYYDGCLLKLIAFRMHEIESSLRRVLVLDADQLILRSLDSLFELPDVDLAAPRAYWIGRHAFASTLMLITLSDRLWQQVNEAMRTIKGNVYDMDLLNQLFDETVLMLPGSYITLNSHFEDWNMPSFYRPQDKDRKINLVDETRREDMADMWEAINVLVQTRPRPVTRDHTGAQKRQLGSVFTAMPSATTSGALPAGIETTSKHHGSGQSTATGTSSTTSMTPIYEANVIAPEMTKGNFAHDVSVESDFDLPDRKQPTDEEDTSAVTQNPVNPPNHGIKAPHPQLNKISEGGEANPLSSVSSQQPEQSAQPLPYPDDQNSHPLRNDLFDLYKTAYVLHYTAIGKPWMHTVKEIKQLKPQAHPALYEQFELWRTEAKKICPRARMVVPADDELGFPEDEFWADVVDIV